MYSLTDQLLKHLCYICFRAQGPSHPVAVHPRPQPGLLLLLDWTRPGPMPWDPYVQPPKDVQVPCHQVLLSWFCGAPPWTQASGLHSSHRPTQERYDQRPAPKTVVIPSHQITERYDRPLGIPRTPFTQTFGSVTSDPSPSGRTVSDCVHSGTGS